MTVATITNSIMGTNSFGLLIDLHLQDYFTASDAIMYYNYIAIFIVMVWAAFAGQSNESRYTFTTPFIAALMVFIGWLHAYNATDYWGSIVFCLLIGLLMYMNDMNHEKYGIPGPGDKVWTVAFTILCFTAAMGFVSSSAFNFFPDTQEGTSQNIMCGQAYTCDASGNIVLGASVTSVSSSGGLMQDVISAIAALPAIAMAIIKLVVVVAGSVVFFSVVMMAAYPILASSPQSIAFMLLLNVVIWAIYTMAFYRIFSGRISGGDI